MGILIFYRKVIVIGMFSIIAMLNFSCRKHWFKTDPLTLPFQDYYGDQLRIDGYYIENEDGASYFFFNNGIILHGGSIRPNGIAVFEEGWLSGDYYKLALKYQYRWGLYIIEGNNIKFERWYPGNPPLPAYVREGTILNDTTFHITESYRFSSSGKKRKVESLDEYYHFRAFSPKPDSTNPYVP